MQRSEMSVQDALWLTMDRPNSLMVIDTVMWFREVPDWDAVEAIVQERLLDRFPVFARRPVAEGSSWFWEDDPTFTIGDHVVRHTLPAPGELTDLQAYVSSQRSVPFDKSKALWTLHLIDGLTFPNGDVGAAVMGRFHHAIADGVRLVQVTLGMCDLAEEAGPTSVGRRLRRSTTPAAVAASAAKNVGRGVADVATSSAGTVKGVVGSAVGGAVETVQTALSGDVLGAASSVAESGASIFRGGLSVLSNPERVADVARLVSSPDNRVVNDVATVGKLALAGTSVGTVWSGTPGIEKGASFAPLLDLAEVKAVRKATGTSVNDVLLAAVSGALTRYLREHGDDTVDEVMWMIPVSIKPFDAELPKDLGNFFALVAFRMPLGIDDRRARLAEVHERMERIKNSDEALLTFGVQRAISQAPDGIASWLTNFFANKAVGVLTNVPGPRQPMTLAGAVVDGVLGWAPCSGDQPMTICIFSYNNKVAIGFGVDNTLVPDGDHLGALTGDEFAQMYAEIVGDQ
jgi:diacylglycerol O-acyltransferase